MKKRIILLHGWGGGPEKLEPLAKALWECGWMVRNLTFPGLSGWPAPGEVWGGGEYADDVVRRIPEEWKKGGYVIFGHSFGGRVAIKMAVRRELGLRAIVLCAPGGLSRANLVKRTVFWLMAKAGKAFVVYMPLAEKYKRFLYRLARQHDYERAEGIMRDIFRKVVGELLMPQVEKIVLPTLILWDRSDRVVPYQDGERARVRIKKLKLVLFNRRGGHKLPYFFPEEVAKEIEKWYGHLK